MQRHRMDYEAKENLKFAYVTVEQNSRIESSARSQTRIFALLCKPFFHSLLLGFGDSRFSTVFAVAPSLCQCVLGAFLGLLGQRKPVRG